MKVRDIMSRDIASLQTGDTVERAAQLMKDHRVGSLPVCSQQKVIGIVTDRDIALRSVAGGQDGKQQKVGDVMSSDPVVGNPEMDVREAALLMSQKQIRRLPIVENNNVVGMVALGDISTEPTCQSSAQQALQNISQDTGAQG